MHIDFYKFRPSSRLPTFANDNPLNAGIDFYADISDPWEILPGKSKCVPTGVGWRPVSFMGFKSTMIIKSRSGLGIVQGIEASNSGVIDEEYRGEIIVKLYNFSDAPYIIRPGDRIAQGVVSHLPVCTIGEIMELDETARGSDGFGSTGR